MSAGTTLTLHTVASTSNMNTQVQCHSSSSSAHLQWNNKVPRTSKSNNRIHNSSSYFKTRSLDANEQRINTDLSGYSALPDAEDALLLERSQSEPTTTKTTLLLHKSSSCNAMFKLKSTVLTQDSKNGRINTSLTDTQSEFDITLNVDESSQMANEVDGNEQDAFLLGADVPNSRRGINASTTRSYNKSKSICYRTHAFITRRWYLSYLVPLSILLALVFVAYLMRDYATQLLYWIETQNPWVIFAVVVVLFIIVSFPVAVGYFVLMITSGYLFGCVKGLLTVVLGANVGIAIAHVTIKSVRHRIPMHKLIKNETGRAILRVISGPRAFKVVLFTRLTPIPFGIQNAIFGVSSIKPRIYHTATFFGLLPAQTINVYLGSTLRSMHEVLNNHGTALTGYISFGIEVICGIGLMFWVVQKARKELSETLLSDISNDGKLLNIQV